MNIGVTFAILQSSWTVPEFMDLLKIIDKGLLRMLIWSLRNLADITSGPVRLLIFSAIKLDVNRISVKTVTVGTFCEHASKKFYLCGCNPLIVTDCLTSKIRTSNWCSHFGFLFIYELNGFLFHDSEMNLSNPHLAFLCTLVFENWTGLNGY